MRANYQQLVKAHQQVARNLGNEKEDENSKISNTYLWKGADSDGRPCSWRDKIPSVSGRLDHLKCTLLFIEEIQVFMDSLFQSFNQQVSMHNFAELSGCVFSWIEEQCKPGDLQVLKKRKVVVFNNVFFPRTWSTQYWDGQGTATEREVKALRIRLTSRPDRENCQCAEN